MPSPWGIFGIAGPTGPTGPAGPAGPDGKTGNSYGQLDISGQSPIPEGGPVGPRGPAGLSGLMGQPGDCYETIEEDPLWPRYLSTTSPILSIVDSTQSTGSVVVFDRVDFTATTDDTDGHTTTGVDLYESGVFVQSLENAGTIGSPTQTWIGLLHETVGAKSYTVRRLFLGGYTESFAQNYTVLDALAPNQITTATLIVWYRCPESIRLHSTLFGTGTSVRTVTISSSTSLDGRGEGVKVTITTTGLPGTGKFKVSIDNGISFVETNVTIPTGAGTHLISGTDLTLTFQQSVSYNNDNNYYGLCSAFLDKVATDNFINDASSGGAASRPTILSAAFTAANNGTGAPAVRFDSATGVQSFFWDTGNVATRVSGASKTFYIGAVLSFPDIQTSPARRDLWAFTNLTDTDQPGINIGVRLGTAGDPAQFRTNRISDTGVIAQNDSGAEPFAAPYFIEDAYDGALRRVSVNAVDFIGGEAGPPAPESSTVTVTRATLGLRQGQSGKTNNGKYDLSEWFCFNQRPSELEVWQLRAYILQ